MGGRGLPQEERDLTGWRERAGGAFRRSRGALGTAPGLAGPGEAGAGRPARGVASRRVPRERAAAAMWAKAGRDADAEADADSDGDPASEPGRAGARRPREAEQEQQRRRERKRRRHDAQQLQQLQHLESFYEKPPPGLIKEDETKPEDCIPDVPGNEHAREFLAHAPTKGLWMPLGKEVKVMQCWRCKRYGHRTGDKECPFFIKGNQKLEQFRVAHEDPMYDIIRENKRHEKDIRIQQLKQLLEDSTSDEDGSSTSSSECKEKHKKRKKKEKQKKKKREKKKKKKRKHKSSKSNESSDSD
ncbi:retinitis pigmentosa 9 protein [Suncus etruscus]|uniref:retinitis pigmentosa 9 protein n=1 Tax=Suncus etruscus TaxID=109475 RepID=UPI002110DB4C|nr:retinitis pigmentosa 9 protein [Suncus etruscus]